MKKLLALSAIAACFATASGATTITSLIGDKDNMGGRLIGDQVTLGAFDNRSLAEAAATNGAQHTDWSDGQFGITDDWQDFLFNYGPVGSITSATLRIAIAGLQSNDNNPLTKSFGEDGLFVDGALVADAFEAVAHDENDFSVVEITLGNAFFAALADGLATIRVDTNSFGGTDLNANGESPVWYDWVELEIEADMNVVPLPAGLPLMLGGLGILGLWRRRQTRD